MTAICCSMFRFCEDDERVHYYMRYANQGDVIAMRELGEFYRFGLSGLKKDFKQAFKWFLKAAGFQDVKATFYVAESYRDGTGIEADGNEAISWFKRIFSNRQNTKLDRGKAAFQIANIFRYGIHTEQNGSSAIKWLKKSILLGKIEAKFKIAEILRNGEGISQDSEQAIVYFKSVFDDKTLDKDQRAEAAIEIAKIYRDGVGIDQNSKMAIKWFKRAAETGSQLFVMSASRSIASIFSHDSDISPNVGNSLKWLVKSAEAGNTKAAFFISDLFRDGNFVNQDAEKAIAWLDKYVSSSGDSVNQVAAIRKIAYIYKNGIGVEPDIKKAEELYKLASSIHKDWADAIHSFQSL